MPQGMWSGLLGAYNNLQNMRQQDIQNNRDKRRQDLWEAQQQRIADEYDRSLTQERAGRYAVTHPDMVKGLISGRLKIPEGPVDDPELAQAQILYKADPTLLDTIGNRVSPEQAFAQKLILKQAGTQPGGMTSAAGKEFYDFYGRAPKSAQEFFDFHQGLHPKSEGVNIDMKQPGAFAQGMGKLGAKIMGEAREQAIAAQAMRNNLQYMLNSKSQAGGPLAEKLLWVKQFGNMLGLGADTKEDEVLQALTNQMTVAARGGAFSGGKPLTGATSDKDIAMLQSSVPGLKQTPEGRKLLAQIMLEATQGAVDRWNILQEGYKREGANFDPLTAQLPGADDGARLHELALQADALARQAPGGAPAPGGGARQSRIDALKAKYGIPSR